MAEEKKRGLFKNLFAGLKKTRDKITKGLSELFSIGGKIDDEFYEELEETLIMADLGMETTEKLIESLKIKVKENKVKDSMECKNLLAEVMVENLSSHMLTNDTEIEKEVILLVGVNGVGKTTTAGKLAAIYSQSGKSVLIAAADTFRAAAIDQLNVWAERANVDIIKGNEGGDPASVVFDAVKAGRAREIQRLIVDTAGRLHNKKNLMSELSKIRKVIAKEFPEAKCTTYVVLDGTTGQNAVIQAREFNEVADIDAIILTKLDGTAKGGIAIAISDELEVPIKYIGVGEKIEDLQDFDADSFVKALIGIEQAGE